MTHGGAAAFGPITSRTLPETPIARLAHDYLQAFNTGDDAKMKAFIESSMEPSATRSTASRVDAYNGLFKQFGSLTLLGVETAASDEITLQLKGNPGTIRLTLAASAPYTRASSVRFGFQQNGTP